MVVDGKSAAEFLFSLGEWLEATINRETTTSYLDSRTDKETLRALVFEGSFGARRGFDSRGKIEEQS